MIKKKSHIKIVVLTSLIFLSILPYKLHTVLSLRNGLQMGSLQLSLAPPFTDKDLFINTRGATFERHRIGVSSGVIEFRARAIKRIGLLHSECEASLHLIKYWVPVFSGEIEKIEVTYTIRGLMRAQAIAKPNSLAAITRVYFKIIFGGKDLVLESKELRAYGTETEEYVFNKINSKKTFYTKIAVEKNRAIEIRVVFYARVEAGGSLEDVSISELDFYSSSYQVKVKLDIYYKEETIIEASITPSKAYLGDTIVIAGKLLSSTKPLPNKVIEVLFGEKRIASIKSLSDGSFTFKYTIDSDVAPGEKEIQLIFRGDANYLPSSAELQLIIPTFNIYIDPSSLKIPVGSNGYSDIEVVQVYGYSKSIEIRVLSAPSWIKYSFIGSRTGTPPLMAVLGLMPEREGYGVVRVAAIGEDGQVKMKEVYVRSYVKPTFKISVEPYSRSIIQGSNVTYRVIVEPINGYRGRVSLSLIRLFPSLQINYTFIPSTVTISSSRASISTLTLFTNMNTKPGRYSFKVGGSDGRNREESNSFELIVKEKLKPTFQVNIEPKNQSIPAGECAFYTVYLTSVNGFKGEVKLNVLDLPAKMSAEFSQNQVLLDENQTIEVLMTIKTLDDAEIGAYNLTLIASSQQEVKEQDFILNIINYPAKVQIYYVNWFTKKLFKEKYFLPFEAIQVVVKYDSNTQITIHFPSQIIHPTSKSIVRVQTDGNGTASAMAVLNGPYIPSGIYSIIVRDADGRVVGKARIIVDIVKIDYEVRNNYLFSEVVFALKWNSTSSPLLNREYTLSPAIDLGDRILFTNPIDCNGTTSIRILHSMLNADFISIYLYYTNTSISLRDSRGRPLKTTIKVRNIVMELVESNCIDLNYKVVVHLLYADNLEPLVNASIAILILDEFDKIVNLTYSATNGDGLLIIDLDIPFMRCFKVKVMCKDASKAWITSTKYLNMLLSTEQLIILISAREISGTMVLELCSKCELLSLNCHVNIEVRNRIGDLIRFYTASVLIRPGIIVKIPLALDEEAGQVNVLIEFDDHVIGMESFTLPLGGG